HPDGAEVLIAGGATGFVGKLTATNSAVLYTADPAGGAGTLTVVGDMNEARDGATATLLNDGTVLIAGCSTKLNRFTGKPTDGLASAEIYNPGNGIFTPTRHRMTQGRAFQAAALLNDGTVLLVGGVDDNGIVQRTAEIYNPNPTKQTFTSIG